MFHHHLHVVLTAATTCEGKTRHKKGSDNNNTDATHQLVLSKKM